MAASETGATLKPASPAPGGGFALADAAQVQAWFATGRAVLIDVREPDEHAREHIDSARLCPLSSFDPATILSEVPKDTMMVLHCKGGKRSADAAAMLCRVDSARGRVISLGGGIEAWKKAGLAVVTNAAAPGLSVMRQTQLVIGAGTFVGAALAWFADPRFVAIPAFFGLGLAFAGATGTCALASMLAKMPWNQIPAAASRGTSR